MAAKIAPKKIPWLKLSLAGGLVVAVAVVVLLGVDVRGLLERVMTAIRDAGPVVYFVAMAILPALGVPVLAFVLPVGALFGERLGMMTVVLLSGLAVTINMVLGYFLARYAFRPVLKKLVVKLGYKLPDVGPDNSTEMIIILRCTPGIPYFVQNYLLGLAEVPFKKYFLLSSCLSLPQNAAFVLFGDALIHGKGKVILLAVSVIIAAVAATHWLRKHYARTPATGARE